MRYIHKYPTLTPRQSQEDYRRDYSDVPGYQNLRDLFIQARELGYYPFRTWIFKDEEWYISENSAPPALLLTGEEAESITLDELIAFFERSRSEWVFIPNEPSEENGWRDWTGKFVER